MTITIYLDASVAMTIAAVLGVIVALLRIPRRELAADAHTDTHHATHTL